MTRTGPSPFFFASLALAAILFLPGPAAALDDPSGAWRPPDLIEAVASFGAVAHDDALYVYGGHVGRTHAHSMENVSPGFRRLALYSYLLAVAPDTGETLWKADREPGVAWSTPVLAPESGTVHWTHRLPASTWTTPLGHGDHVYFFTQDGVTQVLRASAEAPQVVATNHLSVDAPVTGFAAVDDAIVIRAGTEVIRVGRAMD